LQGYDDDERPQKMQRLEGNAEELLGQSLLAFDHDMNEDDEEAPMTAHETQDGDNTVSDFHCDSVIIPY